MKYSDAIITWMSYIRQPGKRKLIQIAKELKNREGLEVGGPSSFFGLRGGFPVYLFAERVDGVNFSTNTVWEGTIREGTHYEYYPGKLGNQYIAEAADLSIVPDNEYDFLLSCHSLEHVANPIKAMREWNRVLKTGGMLVLVLPDKRFSFDQRRSYTEFQHLLDDYQQGVDERDTTHFQEIIECHIPTTSQIEDEKKELIKKLNDNYTFRMAHHHVFNQQLVREVLQYCGFEVRLQTEMKPFHLVTIAHKV